MTSVQDAIASMIRNIEISTGRKLSTWISLARDTGFARHGEILKWLKQEYGLGHSYANYIAKEALKADGAGDDDLLDAQFCGAKSAVRPLYDQLSAFLQSPGSDVEIAPKKNNVSIRRSRQFALLQAFTSSRLDVGMILKGVKPTGRLEAAGSFNAMFTHRVRITAKKEIDALLKAWLRDAYDAAQ